MISIPCKQNLSHEATCKEYRMKHILTRKPKLKTKLKQAMESSSPTTRNTLATFFTQINKPQFSTSSVCYFLLDGMLVKESLSSLIEATRSRFIIQICKLQRNLGNVNNSSTRMKSCKVSETLSPKGSELR